MANPDTQAAPAACNAKPSPREQIKILRDHGCKFIHVIDVETTGLKSEEGDGVVEVGVVLVVVKPNRQTKIYRGESSLVNPYRPISASARGVHHISDADIQNAPELSEAIDDVCKPFGVNDVEILAAHKADFERGFLPMLADRQWICTLQCSQHLWPDAPDFKEQTLRYHLGVDLPGLGAHRALPDATVCAHILYKLLAEQTVDELLVLSATPILETTISFSQYRGRLWTDLDQGMIIWVWNKIQAGINGVWSNPNTIYTVTTEMKRRGLIP
jgi:exodeoxyribonuclease X